MTEAKRPRQSHCKSPINPTEDSGDLSSRDEAITVKDLWYTYPKAEGLTLKGVNLRARRREFLAIMGRTGAGKTTLCLCLNGIIPQYMEGRMEGRVIVTEMNSLEHPIQALATKVGLLFQDSESQIFGITVKDDVAFGPCNLGLPPDDVHRRIKTALATVRLSGYEERETVNLSGGEKQRLAIAGILAMKPSVLVLDEPTSELDPMGKHEVLSTVKQLREERDVTIVMVEHDSEGVARCADRVIVMDGGKIVMEGEPHEVFERVRELKEKGVRPPEVCELAIKLRKSGFALGGRIPITTEEARDYLKELLRKRKIRQAPNRLDDPKLTSPETEPIIEVENLRHTYPGGVEAIRGIGLEIFRGEFLAIVGQNGSGKSTLVKHFNGLLKPTEGRVIVDGVDTKDATVAQLSRKVGYVFQNPDHQIFASTVEEEISYGLKNIGLPSEDVKRRVSKALRFVGLEGKEKRYPFLFGKGERQKIAVASVLAMEPDVLIIDEPTTGQDWQGRLYMMELVNKLHQDGRTIIMITHDMRIVADHAKRVIVLRQGQVMLDGTPKEVFSQTDLLKSTYLQPPEITRLAQSLTDYGVPPDVISVDEMYNLLTKMTG